MIHPVLTLLVASSIQLAAEPSRQADLARLVVEIGQAVQAALPDAAAVAEPLTVLDVPFYYDDLAPLPAPAAPILVTYDWRSPVVFDLP